MEENIYTEIMVTQSMQPENVKSNPGMEPWRQPDVSLTSCLFFMGPGRRTTQGHRGIVELAGLFAGQGSQAKTVSIVSPQT